MGNFYFEVKLRDGVRLDFDKQCNQFKLFGDRESMMVFSNVSDSGTEWTTLGSINVSDIVYIRRRETGALDINDSGIIVIPSPKKGFINALFKR